MSILDDLTLDEKIALEGEIALTLYLSTSLPDMIYRAYEIINRSKRDVRPYLVEAIAEETAIPYETLQKILIEINMGTVPRWIWIDKAIQDLKDTLHFLSTNKEGSSSIACLDRAESKKKIIKSAFALFCRVSSLKGPDVVKELCKRIIEKEKELDFLIPVCINTLGALKEYNPKLSRKDRLKIMDVSFDIRNMLSFNTELKAHKILSNEETLNKLKKENKKDMADTLFEQLFSIGKEGISKECYIVKKTFKGSHVTTVLKVFATEEEALKFVENMEKNFPELLNTCEFEIFKGNI